MPVIPSGAVKENRRDSGGFRVRGRQGRAGQVCEPAGRQPSRRARAWRVEIGDPGRIAARSGLDGDACRFRPLHKPEGMTGMGADRNDCNRKGIERDGTAPSNRSPNADLQHHTPFAPACRDLNCDMRIGKPARIYNSSVHNQR